MKVRGWEGVPAEAVEGMPGVTVRWVVGPDEGAENFAMRVFEMEPGAAIPPHSHWYEQEMLILAGEGVAAGPRGEERVAPGTVLWVEPDEEHAFRNEGAETLRFVCCVPLAAS